MRPLFALVALLGWTGTTTAAAQQLVRPDACEAVLAGAGWSGQAGRPWHACAGAAASMHNVQLELVGVQSRVHVRVAPRLRSAAGLQDDP